MTSIDQTPLPGVGVRHDFATRAGARIGVIAHRSGRRDLLIYAASDPDACSEVVRLEAEEGHALADILGGTSVNTAVRDVQQQVEGLTIDWLRVSERSPAAGGTIADKAPRHDTGAFIIAVVREGETLPAPGGTFTLLADDTAVAIGTPEGLAHLADILTGA